MYLIGLGDKIVAMKSVSPAPWLVDGISSHYGSATCPRISGRAVRNSDAAVTLSAPSSALTSAAASTTPDGVAMRSSEPELVEQR